MWGDVSEGLEEVRTLLSQGKEKEAFARAEAVIEQLYAKADAGIGLWHVQQMYLEFTQLFPDELSEEFHYRSIRFSESMVRYWVESAVTRYSLWATTALNLQKPTDAVSAIDRAKSLAEFLGEPTNAVERARRIDLDFLKDALSALESYNLRSRPVDDDADDEV